MRLTTYKTNTEIFVVFPSSVATATIQFAQRIHAPSYTHTENNLIFKNEFIVLCRPCAHLGQTLCGPCAHESVMYICIYNLCVRVFVCNTVLVCVCACPQTVWNISIAKLISSLKIKFLQFNNGNTTDDLNRIRFKNNFISIMKLSISSTHIQYCCSPTTF